MPMPRAPLHALIWSTDLNLYELYSRGQLAQRFRPGDDDQWRTWLAAHTAVVFLGHAGRINLHNERRTRAKRYWYAYHVRGQRTKRYLGPTANLTLESLEQVAGELSRAAVSAPRASHSPSPASRAQMRSAVSDAARKAEQPLLATKLAPPRLPSALVVRERLLKQMDAAFAHPLTLLSAAAGWGKTTLLTTWLASRTEGRGLRTELLTASLSPQSSALNTRAAWLSLDAQDNQLTRFWLALIAALRRSVPGLGAIALAMLQSPEPPPLSAILTALLNDLASVAESAPLLLILDDYHLIEDEAIHEALTFVLEHLPDKLHLILASRVDPALPLSRWRVQGQLLEIRAADLCFSEAEASSFFKAALGTVLADEDVRLLERRTEGWIAGLQLAALAMRPREDRSAFVQAFSGSHRYLLDYIQEEILERQPLPIQRFLLQSAVLSRITAALCMALTDDPNSQQLLERLERDNLFVVPLDEQRQWYRLHELFREVLLARLQASEPELVPVLHQRAARWYAAEGELREAISHALAGRDFAYAAELIERAAEEVWLSGEIQTLCRWVMALPDVVVRAHARLVLTAALYLLNSALPSGEAQRASVRTQAEQIMARVEAVLQQQVDGAVMPETERALLQQRLRLLRGWYAVFEAPAKGDLEQMRSIWQQMQDLPLEDELPWHTIPLHVYVVLSLREWLVRGEGIVPLVPPLREAKQRVIQSGDRFATIKVMQWLALIYLNIGRLRQVQQECLAALELLQQLDGHSALGGYCRFLLALVLFEWNDLDEARRVLRQMLHDAQIWQQGELEVVGYRLLAEIELNTGNLVEARQALEKAKQLAQQHRFAGYRSWMEALRVELWLAEGNLAAANDWAAYVASHPDDWNIPDQLPDRTVAALVWVYLVQQQYKQALETLERFSSYVEQPDNIAITVRFLALQLVALHYCGKHEQARAVAVRLLALSEQEGYIRVYLQKGELMRGLLESLLRAPRDQSDSLPPASITFVRKLLAAFPRSESVGLRTEYQIPEHSVLSPQSSALTEPLTPREQQVLRLLAGGATNREIAAMLVLAEGTVKNHLTNILAKLGARDRAQAVLIAHDLGLI
jgi:LuxR family maltose regulon positive regulatory protein